MRFSHVLSRSTSSETLNPRKHTPWIVSPLDSRAQAVISERQHSSDTKSNANERIIAFEASPQGQADSELPIFKHHKESSTVELFYDLYFVANLTTFTANHEIVDGESLRNYIGFFTLLWFTWLETSLFDVRFSSDSVFMRICKAASFGVMTGFAISGAIYDTTLVGENAKAFRAMALILMVSRLALVAQYGVILWYVRNYKKTVVPLASTMAMLFISSMIFLGTFWGFPHGETQTSFPIQQGGPPIYVAWYVLVCVEALVLIAISCVWRVVSFKHTHLVERIGLLTLIIMGEGIIGMTKSVSTILQNSTSVSSSDIGVVIASVMLIYFIWILYFDQIEHDRFGTIRQQFWAILHFPLHVGILLTGEGSTKLIIWNIISQDFYYLYYWYPTDGYYDYQDFYYNTSGLVDYIRQGVDAFSLRFKNTDIRSLYDYEVNITSIENVKAEFGTLAYDNTVGPIVDEMWAGLTDVIFQNFDIEGPPSSTGQETATEKANALFNVFAGVWTYFYVAAGVFLIVLSIMYWVGKTHKSRNEFISIIVRGCTGVLVSLLCLTDWVNSDGAVNYLLSAWHIPTVMLTFFVVIVIDNLLVWHTNQTIAKQTSNNRDEYSLGGSSSNQGGGKGDSFRGDSITREREVTEEV